MGKKVLVFNDTTRYQHYGCDLVMHSVHRNLRLRGHRSLSVHWVGTSVSRRFAAIVDKHPDAEAIVVNGEGVIHHDRKHALELANLALLARDAGLPAFLINTALFENSSAVYGPLSGYRGVFVRDGESRAAALLNRIEADQVPDLSFDAVAALTGTRQGRRGSMMTDSVDEPSTRSLRELAQATGSRWRPMRRALPIHYSWLRMIGARRFLNEVRTSEWVLTGRFHAVTLCIATRTPFLAISSNTRKIEALLLDVFGNTARVLPTVPEAETLKSLVRNIAFTEDELAAIERYLHDGEQRTRAMFDQLLPD